MKRATVDRTKYGVWHQQAGRGLDQARLCLFREPPCQLRAASVFKFSSAFLNKPLRDEIERRPTSTGRFTHNRLVRNSACPADPSPASMTGAHSLRCSFHLHLARFEVPACSASVASASSWRPPSTDSPCALSSVNEADSCFRHPLLYHLVLIQTRPRCIHLTSRHSPEDDLAWQPPQNQARSGTHLRKSTPGVLPLVQDIEHDIGLLHLSRPHIRQRHSSRQLVRVDHSVVAGITV